MASIPHRAGPRRVRTSGLRSEISAQLGLDSELPGQQATSVRSARVTGATRPISRTSPSRRPRARLNLPHCRSLTRRDRTSQCRPALHAQQARSHSAGDGGSTRGRKPSPTIGSARIPPPSQRTLLTALAQPFPRPHRRSGTRLPVCNSA